LVAAVQAAGDVPAAGFESAREDTAQNVPMIRSGNADREFVTGMISHHQAEIDLAEVVLRCGSDPEVRKLAQVVAATHTRQLAFLRSWLAEHQAAPNDSANRPPSHGR
jgi:uncharacterized protein (DUF305 family)